MRGGPDDAARRLFVAVPLADESRQAVERLVAALPEPEGRPVRWVRFDGLHLTLRFLGPTEETRLAEVAAAVDETAADADRFAIRLAGAGAFPSPRRPRVLWIGVAEGGATLAALAAALDDRLVPRGWPREERPFRAHLTIARSDGIRAGPQVAAALIAAAVRFEAAFTADRIVLFESRTGGGPARYEPLHVAHLR